MILVIGGTGTVGRHIVTELDRRGHRVRVLTRDGVQARARVPETVTLTLGDLAAPRVAQEALAGVTGVFILDVPGAHETLALARAHGVERVVVLSSTAVDYPGNAIGAAHQALEGQARASGLPCAILRPGAFMSNAAWQWAPSIRAEGVVRAPYGSRATVPIDPRDIAAAAAAALTAAVPRDGIYILTGPELLTPRQQVDILQEELGRPIRFDEVAEAEQLAAMRRFTPPAVAEGLLELLRNPMTTLTSTVRDLTGQAPRSFRTWVRDHREAFVQA